MPAKNAMHILFAAVHDNCDGDFDDSDDKNDPKTYKYLNGTTNYQLLLHGKTIIINAGKKCNAHHFCPSSMIIVMAILMIMMTKHTNINTYG